MKWQEKDLDIYKDVRMNIFEEKRIKISEAVLALDLDGTLTNSKKEITENTKASIDKFVKAGGTVVLASGRPTFGVSPIANILELEKKGGYILSYNGGYFYDCKNEKELFMKELAHEYLPILEEQAKYFGVNLMTYNHDKAYALDIDEQYYMLEVTINHFIRVKVDPLAPQITFPIIKCLMTAPGDHLAKVEQEMKKLWEGKPILKYGATSGKIIYTKKLRPSNATIECINDLCGCFIPKIHVHRNANTPVIIRAILLSAISLSYMPT